MKRAHIIISSVLLGFTGFYAYLITRLPERNLPNTLGADFMPWLLMILLSGLSVLLLITSFFRQDGKDDRVLITLREASGIIGLNLFFIAYVAAMNILGYVIVTPIFIIAMMIISGSRRWIEVVTCALGMKFSAY